MLKCLYFFSIWKLMLKTPCTIFRSYHEGTLMSVAMQNPCRLSIFGFLSRPEVEGAFQNRKPGLFSF